MFLYHYSKEKFDEIRTKENRGDIFNGKPSIHTYLPGRYDQSRSFYFDPIPFPMISKVYGKDHAVWHPGNILFQYVVDSSKIGNFKYHIVETPEKNALVLDDDVSTEDYLRSYPKIARLKGYLGEGNIALEKAAKPFVGKLRDNILLASKIPEWQKSKHLYASFVTHLMLYPASGVVPYEEVTTIKIR